MTKKTWIAGVVLVLVALPAVAQKPLEEVESAVEVDSSPAEEPAPPAEPEAGELETPAAPELPGELFSEGLRIETPASDPLCPVCINSYCAAVGTRCTFTGCSSQRQCCFYDCAPDHTCTSAQKCPINVCFCISAL